MVFARIPAGGTCTAKDTHFISVGVGWRHQRCHSYVVATLTAVAAVVATSVVVASVTKEPIYLSLSLSLYIYILI